MRPDPSSDGPGPVRGRCLEHGVLEYREFFIRHLMRNLRERLPRTGSGAPGCLDIGCNDGRYTRLLSKHGFAAEGVDASDGSIRDAKERNPELSFHQGDAQDLPFNDDAFDSVVCLGLIQCLADWRQAIREAIRVLKPGGVALFETDRAFPLGENLIKCVACAMRRRMPLREINRLFRAHRVGGAGDAGQRKFPVAELIAFFQEIGVARIVLHDPRKKVVFHDVIWAAAVTKQLRRDSQGDENPTDNVDIESCQHCRRRGVIRIKEKLA